MSRMSRGVTVPLQCSPTHEHEASSSSASPRALAIGSADCASALVSTGHQGGVIALMGSEQHPQCRFSRCMDEASIADVKMEGGPAYEGNASPLRSGGDEDKDESGGDEEEEYLSATDDADAPSEE
eukprot:gene13056-3660_t